MEQNIGLQGGGKPGAVVRMGRFYGELKEEIRRVHWTTKEELKRHTKIVVGAVLFFGFLVFGIDVVCQWTVWGLAGVFGGAR
jgi:preprotein translocase subunit SecE